MEVVAAAAAVVAAAAAVVIGGGVAVVVAAAAAALVVADEVKGKVKKKEMKERSAFPQQFERHCGKGRCLHSTKHQQQR